MIDITLTGFPEDVTNIARQEAIGCVRDSISLLREAGRTPP